MPVYEIKINNNSLKLKTDHDLETIEVFKSEVEHKIKKILDTHQSVPFQQILLLTCLHLVEAKFNLQKAVYKDLDQIDKQAKDILKDIEPSSTPDIELQKVSGL